MPHEYSEDQVREFWSYCGEVEALDLFTFKDSGRFGRGCDRRGF
jgi:nucleolin